MTPTDELCAKLDELGIKYTTDDSDDYEVIEWGGSYNLWWQFVYDPYEGEPYGELRLLDGGGSTSLTPEQAIAATVGTEPDEATMLKLHDRMNAALLDYESAMGIDGGNGANTVPFVNEMHQIIEDTAKAGVGTCHIEECEHEREIPYDLPECDGSELWFTDVTYDCDECGYENTDPNIRFCGGCGRKVVDKEESE